MVVPVEFAGVSVQLDCRQTASNQGKGAREILAKEDHIGVGGWAGRIAVSGWAKLLGAWREHGHAVGLF